MALRPVLNEKELLIKVARGDEDAFAALFYAYAEPLGQYLITVTGSRQQAEDIVQDVFIRAWQQREQLAAIHNFTSWLFILARNHTVNAFKKRVTDLARYRRWIDQFDQEERSPAEGTGDDYRIMLERAIDRLPAQQQRVFRLSRQERLTYHEIAETMGIAPSTVKSYLEQAIQSIKRQLQGPVDPAILLILLTPLTLG